MGKRTLTVDWIVIIPIALLSFLSLLTIASIQPSFLVQQAVFIALGVFLFVALQTIDVRVLKHFAPVIYVVSVVLLIATNFGPEIRGSMRWLVFGPIRIQPSELVKPLLLVFFASFLSQKRHLTLRMLLLGSILFLIPAAVLFWQPDLGNVLVYISFFASMLLIAGLSPLVAVVLTIGALLLLPLSYSLLQEYQRARITAFLSPMQDPQGIGYNALQAVIAVGSGKLFGRGFGRGIQSHLRFLPENHTDFIFASFIEELGFFGGLLLLITMLVLLLQILSLARKAEGQPFIQIYCIGLFVQIFAQVVINVGMNIGILPITGITLPLVSYGGSSIIATFIGLGIFASMKKSLHNDTTLAIR